MKIVTKLFVSLVLVCSLSSCGMNRAWVFNQNQNATQVHLSSNNFKVIGQVEGTADVDYVLVFGAVKKKQLYETAYKAMSEQADLSSGPRALTNILTEEHVGGVPPFYTKRTVTVSATLIEFIQ